MTVMLVIWLMGALFVSGIANKCNHHTFGDCVILFFFSYLWLWPWHLGGIIGNLLPVVSKILINLTQK